MRFNTGAAGLRRRRPAGDSSVAGAAPFDALTWALIAMILCYVWRIQDVYPVLATVRAPILSTGAVLALFAIDADRRRALTTVNHRITACVLIILGLAILSVPTSVYQGLSFRYIIDVFGKNVLLFVILVASIRGIADVRRFAGAMVIGAGLYAQYVYFNIEVGENGRLGDLVYYDANDLGMLLVCTIPLALFFVFNARLALARVGAATLVLLFILLIIKSGSRGAFLGLISISMYLLFRLNVVKPRIRIGAVVVGVVLLSSLASDQYWNLMRTLLYPQEDYNWSGQSETGRMEVWKRGVGYMLDRPLTGVGVAAFGVAEGTISPLADQQNYGIGLKWSTAHNSFLQIGAELGVGGLITFIVMIGAAYRQARRTGSHRQSGKVAECAGLGHALAAAVVGYSVSGFFLSQAYSVYALVLFGLIVALAGATRTTSTPRSKVRSVRPTRAAPHPALSSQA